MYGTPLEILLAIGLFCLLIVALALSFPNPTPPKS